MVRTKIREARKARSDSCHFFHTCSGGCDYNFAANLRPWQGIGVQQKKSSQLGANQFARDSKPEPVPKVVPPSTNPDSPKPDNRHATAHRSAVSAPPPIHRTQTFVTFFVFNPNGRHLVCSVDLMKVALCTQLSQAISRNLPPNENSWQKLFDIAIQHFLISLVTYAGTGYGMHSESDAIIFKQHFYFPWP